MKNSTGDTAPAAPVTLRLRRQVEWVPVAALVVVIAWGIAVGAVVEGPNGAAAGLAMSLLGVPIAVIAVTFAGHLVRPLRLVADARGLTVRLPVWPPRTLPWTEVSGVAGISLRTGSRIRRFVVVDFAAGPGVLPRTCRPRAMYRKLAPVLGRRRGDRGLCFEDQIFDLSPAELIAAIREYAPEELPVEDRTADPVDSPWRF